MRKPIGLFIAAFATVAGGGLALAVEGEPAGPPDEVPPVELPAAAQRHDAGETEEPETEEVEVQVEEPEVQNGVHPDNHGALVSEAAQGECQEQTETNHGECVSAVARDHDDDGTPDHGPGSPDHPGGGGPDDED